MIDDLRPFPTMKPTGVDWLGEVPAHWDVRRIKTLLKEVDSRTKTGEERLLSLRMRKGLVDHADSGGRPIPPEALINYKIVEPGQVVMNRMRAAAGLFGVADVRGLVSPDYAVFEPKADAVNPYLLQAFMLPSLAAVFRAESKGLGTGESGFLRLYTDRFGPIPVPHPPLDEQRLIVRFLNWHGGQVARLIRAKKKLIALLNEQKQAIIHRAVTRGLDPNAKLKPSGITWLGDVPEGWDVIKLSRLVRNSNAGEVIDKGWWGRGEEDLYTCARNPLKSDFFSFPQRKRTTGLDLLLTRNGTPYIHRPVANAIYSNVVQRINLIEGANREYVALALEVAARSMKGYGVSIESLNYDMWKVLTVLCPTREEQEEIVQFVSTENKSANLGISLVEREIALIQEFRTRIVADVVTGKLDVRAIAASLPETEEYEVADDLSEDDELDDMADVTEDEEAAA